MNRGLDLDPGRSRAGCSDARHSRTNRLVPQSVKRLFGKASPRFHERLVADRICVRDGIESARPVSRPPNAQRSRVSFHSDRLETRKRANRALSDSAGGDRHPSGPRAASTGIQQSSSIVEPVCRGGSKWSPFAFLGVHVTERLGRAGDLGREGSIRVDAESGLL